MSHVDLGALCGSFAAALRDHDCPGAAIAFIRDGAPVLMETFGEADRETGAAVTPQTLFSLQSVSKTVAALCVLHLADRGLLELDDPVERRLVRWRLPTSPFPHDGVTIRRLLSHHAGVSTSGFPGIPGGSGDISLIDALNGLSAPLTSEQDEYWKEWSLSRDWAVRIVRPPGEGWAYANGGFGILQVMLEDIVGKPYSEIASEIVFGPLGMSGATFDPQAERGCALPYGPGGRRREHYRIVCGAAGGAYASISDISRLAAAMIRIRDGEGIISRDAALEMLRPHGLADKSGEVQFETGLGCLLLGQNSSLNVHHSGGSIGWRSVYSVFPESGDGICILVNSDQANPVWIPLVRRWRELIAP